MNLYDENLAYFDQMNHVLYEDAAKRLDALSAEDSSVSLCMNKAGQKNVAVREGDREIFIHSQYNVLSEAERWASGHDAEAGLVVVFGLGMGYHLAALLKAVNPDAAIFVVEPDTRIFKLFLENGSMKALFSRKNTFFILNDNDDVIVDLLFGFFKTRPFEKADFRVYSNYAILYADLFGRIQKRFADMINLMSVNLQTNDYFKEMWIANFIMNISNINGAYNGKEMENLFRDVPALIVSAGPSLERNIEQIRELSNRCVVLAGGSALTILKKNNITPRFAVVIDGSPLIKDIYRGIEFEGISLIYLNRCYYELIDIYPEKKIVFIDSLDHLARIFGNQMNIDFQEMPPDATVAGINVGIATHFGCNPVVLVGQDFACTDLKFHAEGAAHNMNFEEQVKSGDKDLVKAIDIYGEETYTTRPLLASKSAMENKVKAAVAKGFRFINATEGGIGVDLCEVRDFRDVTNAYMKQDYDLDGKMREFYEHGKGHIEIGRTEYRNYFDGILSESAKLLEITKRLVVLIDDLKVILDSHRFQDGKHIALAKQINKLQTALEEDPFYKTYIIGSIEQTIAIHKIIMDSELTKNDNDIVKNMARMVFVKKQSLETAAVCEYINSLIHEVYRVKNL